MPGLSCVADDLLGAFKQLNANSGEALHVGPLETRCLQHDQARVRGLTANKLIRESDDVLYMPCEFILTPKDFNGSRFDTMPPRTKLVFLLAEARNASPKAKVLAAYLSSLPSLTEYRGQGLPLTASEADLKTLAGLPRLHEIASSINKIRLNLQEKLDQYNGSLDGSSLPPLKWDDILWAVASVSTRGFMLRTSLGSRFVSQLTPAMVPIADLINHSDDPNVGWYWQHGIVPKMVMTALRDIKPGEELTNSYGHNGNGMDFFQQYGIVDRSDLGLWDPRDCETIRAAHLEQADSTLLRRAHNLAAHHCKWNADAPLTAFRGKSIASKEASVCVSGLLLPPPRLEMLGAEAKDKFRKFL